MCADDGRNSFVIPKIIEPSPSPSRMDEPIFYLNSPGGSGELSEPFPGRQESQDDDHNGMNEEIHPRVTWLDLPSSRSFDSSGSSEKRNSRTPDVRHFTKRASQIILEVPAAQLRKINKTEGVSSIRRETKHFCDNTTLHGPKRIFYGKKWSTWFWVGVSLFSLSFFIYQVVWLVTRFVSTPTVSQVSYIMDDAGLPFPMVTMCNFNPIKKTKIKELNVTGDLPDSLLDYLMQANEDAEVLFWNADRSELHVGDSELNLYQKKHPNFTIEGFYMDAGFDCPEIMKLCSFGGRSFNCCAYMEPDSGKDWMQRQSAAGVNAGLQLILDSHLEEQFDGTGDDADPIFSNAFENGFRYYIHAVGTIPYLASEGISVSPSTRVYSAMQTNKIVLLGHEHWGNCTSKWPQGYLTYLPYTSANCASLCKARFFELHCGCSPFTYDIDYSYPVCTPYQTVQCFDQFVRIQDDNGTEYFAMPTCTECRIECESTVYHAYNSYGHGFSNGALKWLNKKDPTWSIPHIKSNFLTINVFFRDMGHTENTQLQATSLTETLSDIGGNMGMFLGMSIVTILEISLYLSKISWIMFSKKRRQYMYRKKQDEEEHEKQLEEAVSGFKLFRHRKEGGTGSFRNTRRKISELRKNMKESFRTDFSSGKHGKVGPKTSNASVREMEKKMDRQRENFMHRKHSLYLNEVGKQESIIQLELDVAEIQRNIDGQSNTLSVKRVGRRKRASTAPSVSSGSHQFYIDNL